MNDVSQSGISLRQQALTGLLVLGVLVAGLAAVGARLHQAGHGDHSCGEALLCTMAAKATCPLVIVPGEVLPETPRTWMEEALAVPEPVISSSLFAELSRARAPPSSSAV